MKSKRKLRKEITWLLIVIEAILISCLLLVLSVDLPYTIPIEQEFMYFLIACCTMILCLINCFIIKRFGSKKVIRSIIDYNYHEEKLR